MRPSQAVLAIRRAIRLKAPTMLHGSPGIGKSDIVRQAAKLEGYDNIIDLRLSQLDQVDLRGVPSVTKDNHTRFNPPTFLPSEGAGNTLLFLDEINAASAGVMAASYELVLDRRIGEYKLPASTAVIAAGNRNTDHAMVNAMPSALKNRMKHITLDVHNDDWCEWAMTIGGINANIISFLRFRPVLLNEFDNPAKTSEGKQKARNLREAMAFATPRSWAMMSKYVDDGVEPEIEYETYCGIVGEAAAAEFAGFQKYYRDLPNLDQCLLNPKSGKIPTEPATLYALATGLAAKATPDNFERVIQYISRIPEEFQVMTIRDANLRCPEVVFTAAFNNWAVEHQQIIRGG